MSEFVTYGHEKAFHHSPWSLFMSAVKLLTRSKDQRIADAMRQDALVDSELQTVNAMLAGAFAAGRRAGEALNVRDQVLEVQSLSVLGQEVAMERRYAADDVTLARDRSELA